MWIGAGKYGMPTLMCVYSVHLYVQHGDDMGSRSNQEHFRLSYVQNLVQLLTQLCLYGSDQRAMHV